MLSYAAPREDILFLLNEVLNVSELTFAPRLDALSNDLIASIIDEAGRFASEVLLPLNQSGDAAGCRFDAGMVQTPKGFKEAYQAYVRGGWPALHASLEFGGQGLPHVISLSVTEMLTSANMSFSFYPGLTGHAITPIERFASSQLKDAYLPKLVSGEWSGTMNLTEPQCGSDLSLLRTKAVPDEDGAYRISGTKIFITAGEHDLTENIIHLVLARLADAPAGVRGISLFLVPKFLPDAAGLPTRRNGVRCTRLEEKMGIHGSATCELVYEDAVGYLIGEPNKGLAAMFTMMNEARIGAGIQGIAVSEIAYQNACEYSRTRLQGRAQAHSTRQEGGADPIIRHADVRRMLLRIRAFTEGGRGLAYWTGLLADLSHAHPDPAERQRSSDLLEALTPILKAYLSDGGLESTILAMQCFGGHGYMREWGLEQLTRDARIVPIYEGTNGIQAMDLVARRLLSGNAIGIELLFTEIETFANRLDNAEPLAAMRKALLQALDKTREVSRLIIKESELRPDFTGAVAYDYLNLMGVLAMGFIWLRMAACCIEDQVLRECSPEFYAAKMETARFFFASTLPTADLHCSRILQGAEIASSLKVMLS